MWQFPDAVQKKHTTEIYFNLYNKQWVDLNATFKDKKFTHDIHEKKILTYTVEADVVVVVVVVASYCFQ